MASVASTYARAFADVVMSAHLDANRAVGGLREIVRLLDESADLRRVWENPAVPAEQKRNLLDAIVQREGIDKQVRNLIAVLIDHRRMPFLPRIIEQLEKELDARLGFAEAQISSARELCGRGEADARIADGENHRQESSRPLCAGLVAAGRRRSPRGQHDLRRFGKRAAGEDQGSD